MDKLLPGLTDDQRIEIQRRQLEDLVNYLLKCESKVKGFGYHELDMLAMETNMAADLKAHFTKCLDNPDKKFEVKFKRNIILP